MIRRLAATSWLAIGIAACTAPIGVVPSPDVSAVASSPPVAQPTADDIPAGVLQVGSVLRPTPEQAEVLVKCQVGDGMPIDPKQVIGMAELADGAEITHFVPLSGREPQLKDPDPVWVVQVSGEIPQLGGEVWVDPTCVVTRDVFGYFATGPVRNPDSGEQTSPEPPRDAPDRVLPTPQP
jgi:hypothetical protein